MISQKVRSFGLMTALIAFTLTAGCAYQSSSTNFLDIGVIRADAEGETLWDQTIDSGYGDHLSRMHPLSDVVFMPENKVFVGYNLLYPPSSDPCMYMGWITCLGPDGEELWVRGSEWPVDFSPTLDGGCIVVAEYASGPSIVMIGSDGMARWGIYASAISFEPTAIASMNSGNYIVGGRNVLAWIDENGTVLNVKRYTEWHLGYVDTIIPMTDGGCVAVDNKYENPLLTRLDTSGEILWNTSGLITPSEDQVIQEIRGVREIEGGGMEMLVVKETYGKDFGHLRDIVYAHDGTVLKEKTFEIPQGSPITWATDGGYMVAALMDDEGRLSSYTSDSGSPVHLIKYSETGHQEWDRTVGSKPDMDRVVTINAVGEDGYVVVGERNRS